MNNKGIFVLATAAVMLFTACHKDNDSINMNANIVAYGNNGSKVYVDDAHYANWNNGDKVMINGVNYTVGVSGNIASINGVAVNENGYYAIYPSDRATVSGSGYPSILMPQVQIYKTDASGNQLINAPMAAYCPSRGNGTHSLNFVNLCSLIKVNLSSEQEVAYINVTSTDNFLWGKATVEGDDNPVLSIDNSATANVYTTDNKTVTLDCTTNGSNGSDNNGGSGAATGVTSAGPFYVVVPARTYTNLTVDVYVFETNNNGRRTVKLFTRSANASNNAATVESNMIYAVTYSGEPTPVQPPYPGLGTGEFSVSNTKKVRFSLGNLQYQASTGLWRFAANQWDVVGNAAGNTTASPARENQSDWIDLFGYGTSGNEQGSTTYYPYQYERYTYGPTSNISGTQFDWGVNEICNGGNQPNKWRTLTKDEWQFLINNASGSSATRRGKCGLASVTVGEHTYKGFVLVPDNYTGLSFTTNEYKVITESNWNIHSQNGCIFLPCAGIRNGLAVSQDYVSTTTNSEMDGYYWSSSYSSYNESWLFKLKLWQNNTGGEVSCIDETTDMGLSVRLVRDVD